MQPLLIEMDREMEEAAASLGASGFTIFRRIIFPNLLPGLAAGVALAFARALGEYGSVLLFAGGLPNTQVSSVFIRQQIENGNEHRRRRGLGRAAAARPLVMLGLITLIQRWSSRHERSQGAGAGGLTVMPMSGEDFTEKGDDDEAASSARSRWGLRVLGLGYLTLLLLAPLVLIFYKTFEHGLAPPLDAITSPDGLHALKLTLLMVAIAVPLNTIFGVGCALLLVRHRGRATR